MRGGIDTYAASTSSNSTEGYKTSKRADYATLYNECSALHSIFRRHQLAEIDSTSLFVGRRVTAHDRVMPLRVLGVARKQLLGLICKATI